VSLDTASSISSGSVVSASFCWSKESWLSDGDLEWRCWRGRHDTPGIVVELISGSNSKSMHIFTRLVVFSIDYVSGATDNCSLFDCAIGGDCHIRLALQ